MPKELRPIPGLPGYSVTADGQIWSEGRLVQVNYKTTRWQPGRWLKPYLASQGYFYVTTRYPGKLRKVYTHRAVASAWVSNPDPEHFNQVNHISGIKSDNAHTNLEWCDQHHNQVHAYSTGLRVSSQKEIANARRMGLAARHIDFDRAQQIRVRRAAGARAKDLAVEFGICPQSVTKICTGRSYINPGDPNAEM